MGSIAVVLSRSALPDLKAVEAMLSAAPHRGGVFEVRTCERAILGTSNHPDFADASISSPGDLIAAFSGRLDNAADLTQTLVTAGFPPASNDPADVVVATFRAFGAVAPSHMRGNFAAVITDGRRMWTFRDHLGFQPLFYADTPKQFVAATEVKQVIAGAGISREPDLQVLERIFYGHLRPDMPSVYRHVSRIPHATTVSVNGHGADTRQTYWHPERVVETATVSSFEDLKEQFDHVFARAVGRCLTGSDVIALSGGIDSPAVAGYAAPLSRAGNGGPLGALSLVFPAHPRVDERPYIEVVTQSLGLELHTHVTKSRVHDDLVHWISLLDGPIPNISAPEMYEFYSEARRLGFRNVLTGDVAECVVDLPLHVAGHLLVQRRFRSLLKLLAMQRRQGASLKKWMTWRYFASQLALPFIPGRIANWYATVLNRGVYKRLPDWVDPRKAEEVPYRNDLLAPSRARWASVQLMPLQGCPITMEGVEHCAALAGVTVRRPFADVDLWEFFLSLPAEIKYPDLRSKTLLRRLLRGTVPDKILDRRDKTYFDDHMMSQLDYPVLKQFLSNPVHHIAGVDYRKLNARLERGDLNLMDWIWLKDLLPIHGFLKQW